MLSESERIIAIPENTPIQEQSTSIGARELGDRIEKAGKKDEYYADNSKLDQNPGEKSAFDTKYINGFGGEVTLKDGTKMSFATLFGAPKEQKDAIINGLTRVDKIAFREWEVNASNQKESEIDKRLQASNQRVESKVQAEKASNQRVESKVQAEKASNQRVESKQEQLIIFQEKIKTDLASANQILGNKFPKISNDEKQSLAQRIPQLQGVDQESLKSGKYDDIITAYYLVRNESKIAESIPDPADRIKFLTITNSLDQTFGGIEKDVKIFGKKVDTMVLGHGVNPDDIKSRGGQWIREGYSNVTFNNQTREFTFQNERTGVSKKINLKGQIARESISKNGLSISRELIPASKEEVTFEKKYINYQETTEKIIQESEHSPRTPELDELNSPDKISMNSDFKEGRDAESKGNISIGLSLTEKGLTKKIALLEDLIGKKIESGEGNSADTVALKDKKVQIQSRLDTIRESINRYIILRQEEEKIKGGRQSEDFDNNAENSINILSEFGLNNLGQAGMEDFLEAWNYKNKNQKEFQIHFQNGKIESQQENALRTFIHRRFGEANEVRNMGFQKLKRNLTNIGFIENKWSTLAKRSQFLFELPKSETT